jgi:hypothetical protein
MNIQAVHKQRRVLGPIGISSVFEHVVSKGADGVEVFAAVVWIGSFFAKAD